MNPEYRHGLGAKDVKSCEPEGLQDLTNSASHDVAAASAGGWIRSGKSSAQRPWPSQVIGLTRTRFIEQFRPGGRLSLVFIPQRERALFLGAFTWLADRAVPRFFDVSDPRQRILERLPYELDAAELVTLQRR